MNGLGGLTMSNLGDQQSTVVQSGAFSDTVDEGKLLQLCKVMEANESDLLPQSQRGDINPSLVQAKQEEVTHQMGEVFPGVFSTTKPSIGSLTFSKPDNGRTMIEVKDMNQSSSQPSLSMTLGSPSTTPNLVQPFTGGLVDGREHSKTPSSFTQGQKSRPILPKPSKTSFTISSETNKGGFPNVRVARPPADGRGKSQLLPRYWPRITDQELQKLSGEYP